MYCDIFQSEYEKLGNETEVAWWMGPEEQKMHCLSLIVAVCVLGFIWQMVRP